MIKPLQGRILSTRALSLEQRKTGAYLHMEIMSILCEFKLEEAVNNIAFVTDRGSNIILALDSYTRISCFAHFMNNIV